MSRLRSRPAARVRETASSFGCGCGSDRYVDTTDEVRCRFGRCKFFHPGYGGHKQTRSAPTRRLSSYPILAPAVGFEPTTNRLTADRSTTELRWKTVWTSVTYNLFST